MKREWRVVKAGVAAISLCSFVVFIFMLIAVPHYLHEEEKEKVRERDDQIAEMKEDFDGKIKDLSSKHTVQDQSHTDEIKRLKAQIGRLVPQRDEAKRKLEIVEVLRQSISPTPPQPPPTVEGIRVSYRRVPSERDDYPFALEATIQVQSAVAPFGIGFIASTEIKGKRMTPGVYTMSSSGELSGIPEPAKTWSTQFETPAVTPQKPLVVRLYGKEAFRVERIIRINF